jgi:uncharacterized membrane protein YoaK (UPF0700 family)
MPKITEFTETIFLCLVGGSADAVAYVRYATFVGAMTGNTVLLGIDIANAHFDRAAYHLCIIAVFFSMIVLTQLGKLSKIPVAALLIGTAILLFATDFIHSQWSAAIAAAALGAQNAAVRSVGGVSLNSAFVTGDLLRLGVAVPHAGEPEQRNRVTVLAAAWMSYVIGALLGALALKITSLPMAVPAVLALVGAVAHSLRKRERFLG